MKVSAYTCLHYGLDYIFYAVKSVIDHVDEFIVSYTPHPSHGHSSNLLPIETERELRDIVMVAGGAKIRWHHTNAFWQEGQHRDYAKSLCSGDLILVVDADEVWHPDVLERVLKMAWDNPSKEKWRVNFTTPWRSFCWKCTDDLWPDRVFNRQATGQDIGYVPQSEKIFHFGYAVTSKVLTYKMSCHGHKAQWRPNWLETKWKPWPPVPDCHPTDVGKWTPEPLDKRELPEVLADHPFRNLEPIP